MGALEHSKIRAHCLRFDFLPNQLDLIKAPGIRKKICAWVLCGCGAQERQRFDTPLPRGNVYHVRRCEWRNWW